METLIKITDLLKAAEVVLMCQIQGKPIPPEIQKVWDSREKIHEEAKAEVEKCTRKME